MSSDLQHSHTSAGRGRSGLGLLIVGLILAQIFLFGSETCPVRPAEFVRGRGEKLPDDLQLLRSPGTTPAKP